MLRYIRTFTLLVLILLLSGCQSLIVPMPVVMPAAPVVANPRVESLAPMTPTPLFTITIALSQPRDVGSGPLGIRFMSEFTGGAVTDADFGGDVAVQGEHWYLIRLDNVAELVIQGVLKTASDESINFKVLAFARMDPARMEQVLAGELVDPSQSNFRGVAFFTTAATQFDWLNQCVPITTLTYDLQQVQIAVYDSGDLARSGDIGRSD